MRDAAARTSGATDIECGARLALGFAASSRAATERGTLRTRVALCALLVCSVLGAAAMSAGSASAAYVHSEAGYEFGNTGTAASTFSGSATVGEMDYNQSTDQLFILNKGSDHRIYGFHYDSPAHFTPTGTPLSVGAAGCCTDIAVDGTAEPSAGNIYYAPDSPTGAPFFGYTAAGAALPAFAPTPGETCGVAVDNDGHVWSGNFNTRLLEEFQPSGGGPIGSIDVSAAGAPCKLRFDQTTNDAFVPLYFGNGVVRYTASSGYTAKTIFDPTGNANVAINGTTHTLYVARLTEIYAYNTETGLLRENFGEADSGCFYRGIAVDETTDTVFTSLSCTNTVQEWQGATVPDVVTNAPTGNTGVSGTVSLGGGGDVIACYFEFGTTTEYGQTTPCDQPTPYSADQPTVTADLRADLFGDITYHYRLVASNAQGTGRGQDQTITPHNIDNLETKPATDITNVSANLHASFDGNGEETHYYFEWGKTTSYGQKTAVPPGPSAGVTTGPTDVESELTGLTPGSTYHFRVIATNGLGKSKGADETFKTREPPSIHGSRALGVTSSAATIEAKINPNDYETDYYVEYGLTPEYGAVAPVPAGHLDAANAIEAVTIDLTGLGDGVYHFSVVAENIWGKAQTADQTFTFLPPSCPNASIRQKTKSSYLPDCRAYELVSPSEAGNIVFRNFSFPAPYATNPPRFLYAGFKGIVEGTDAPNSDSVSNYVATRSATGWTTTYPGIKGSENWTSYFAMGDRQLDKFMNFKGLFGTELPHMFNVDGSKLGQWPLIDSTDPTDSEVEGMYQPSPDFSHMAFSTRTDFSGNGEGLATAPGSAYDYDAESRTSTLISRLQNGFDIVQDPNVVDPKELIMFAGMTNIEDVQTMYPGVSIDGSHILMTTRGCTSCTSPVHLYMSVNDAITYDLTGGHAVGYAGMTSDGREVFFTSAEQLTTDDTDSSVDLFMWSQDAEEGGGDPITRLSAGGVNGGNGDACGAAWTGQCNVGTIEGNGESDYAIATDTGDIVFYSPDVIDDAEDGELGGRNLYLYRDGHIYLLAKLGNGGGEGVTRIQVSPDGMSVAIVTTSELTAYESEGFAEMYSLDWADRGITCVSCLPSGDPPTSDTKASASGLFMTDDGRPFFSTEDPLVATDTNEGEDVYEYVDGRPQLVSTGTGSTFRLANGKIQPIALMGVSPDGVDAYFSTFDTLVTQDRNGAFLKFYDARTGGGFPVTTPNPPCEAADECHGAGSLPPAGAVITSDGALPAAPKTGRKKAKHGRRHHRQHRKKGRKRGARGHRTDRARGAGQ